LKEVSFAVGDGEFCILLGPSGCGKTTLLRLVAGLEEASSGTIALGGERIDFLPPRQRDIAFVFQSYALYPHMSVYENLAFSLRLRRYSTEEIERRVLEAAKLLEIGGYLDRKPQQLSGGQRQRVAVGRAIVRQPLIFLFDEPLSNLDAALRASMRVEIARLHRRLNATILYVTHDQAEAMTLGEKIVVLKDGEIQQIGTPAEVYHRPKNIFVAGFIGSPPMNLVEGEMDQKGAIFKGASFTVDLSAVVRGRWREYAGKPLVLGIRPEHLQPTGPENAWLHGEAEIVEDLGSDRFVHLRCGPVPLTARLPGTLALRRGETLHLAVDPNRIHLFHEGQRIN
jgi:multiple sugar transport system ATP-binding protein